MENNKMLFDEAEVSEEAAVADTDATEEEKEEEAEDASEDATSAE